MSALDDFTAALARAAGPQDGFAALDALAAATVGAKLFTVMVFDAGTRMARRAYSNMPDAYPVSGTKPANETDWSRHVLDERRIFVANDIDAIRAVFFDHEVIAGLGCESAVNVPVVVGGAVLGTVNLLHEAGFYTPARVAAAGGLALPGAACLLFARLRAGGTGT